MGLRKNRIEVIASVILLAGLCFIFWNRSITWVIYRLLPDHIQRDMIFQPDGHHIGTVKLTLMIFGWVFFTAGTYTLIFQTLKKKSEGN